MPVVGRGDTSEKTRILGSEEPTRPVTSLASVNSFLERATTFSLSEGKCGGRIQWVPKVPYALEFSGCISVRTLESAGVLQVTHPNSLLNNRNLSTASTKKWASLCLDIFGNGEFIISQPVPSGEFWCIWKWSLPPFNFCPLVCSFGISQKKIESISHVTLGRSYASP